MTLRLKLTLSFLLVSLLTAGAVGATAWWMLMHDFRDAVREQAFKNFQHDVAAYVARYGSWEQAERAQPFPAFVAMQRAPRREPGPPDAASHGPVDRTGQPPFRFLLLTPDGKATRSIGDFAEGQVVPEQIRRQAKPILLNGRPVLYAVPIGEPSLSPQDRAYLELMRHALAVGMAVAAGLAILFGIGLGSRLVASLRELVDALGSMRPDGEMPRPVAIRSRDEIGLLAQTFNRISRLLVEAHRDLQASNATIHAQAELLREQSLHDALTSLHNRRYFDEQALTAFRHALRYDRPMCVMLADLDHFKAINDTFSHAVGDAVLRRTAKLLQENIRSSDLLARYGGEEFAAVFTESTMAHARQRCEALRRCIETEPWEAIAPGLEVTISVGLCDDTELDSIGAMLGVADEAMYRAKKLGRNRVEPQEG